MLRISPSRLFSKTPFVSSQIIQGSPFDYYYPGCSENIFNSNYNHCPISLSTFSSTKARPKNCNHIFCFSCINKWSKTREICPMCRTKFTNIIII